MDKKNQNEKFWNLSVPDVVRSLDTDLVKGLSNLEVQNRLARFGKNTIQSSGRTDRFKIFLNQLKSPLIIVLLVACAITLLVSHYRDAVFILLAVIVNTTLGFYQENKAETALSELRTYLRQRTRVIREDKEREIDAEDVVVGDIIRLSQGDRVPADARVFFVNDFFIDEAVLTGESLPVVKSSESVSEEASISDQNSMVFAGTLVTQGVCSAIVCRTDSSTELGRIATLISISENEKTPLQKAIIKFSVYSSIILAILTAVVFFIGIYAGHTILDMFLTSIAIAVSAIPEGLPVSMTVILAVGVERMAKRKGVVRKLVAAEALGSTTIILTDKTGTLTMAKMILSQVIPYSLDKVRLLKLAVKNSDVLIENPETDPNEWKMSGKIMEMALVRSAALNGINVEEIMSKKHTLQTIPFNAVQKFSASLIKESEKHFIVFLGAADVLIKHSVLDISEKEKLTQQVESLAYSGERVLGLAIKEIEFTNDFSLSKNPSLSHLSFGGLITFSDPVRPGVKQSIQNVRKAGIKTVILTGDHRGTAVSIAKEVGVFEDNDSVMDASELSTLSDDDLKKRLPYLSVISRVTPYDKLRVAKLYQELGEVVAMTGDGVNDAPSIKQANIGIAMGSGTEVAQSVADLVLLDDNFETIVAAIAEGRQILGNIRKVLVYLLSNVADGLILIGGSLVTGLPLPLNALQILWVNFFTDSFPAMAFAFEEDSDSLSIKPRGRNLVLFDPLMKFLIIVIGVSTSVLLFVVYYILLKMGFDQKTVSTFIFAAFGTYTLILSFSVRSLKRSIFSYNLFSNHYLTGGVLIGMILMAVAIYVPVMQKLFGTVSLSAVWVLGVVVVGCLNIFLIEIAKFFFRSMDK